MNDRGFTLLEALVALGILSAVVTTALSIAGSSIHRSTEALGEFRAFLMADAILQRTGPEIALVPGRDSGRLADGSIWRLSIEELQKDERGSALFGVEVEIEPTNGRAVKLETTTETVR